MKYVVIIVAVVILVRIDVLLHLFDKASNKLDQPGSPAPSTIIEEPSEVIAIKDDMALNSTPRSEFFTLLSDFQLTPVRAVREKLMDVLRKNPTMIGPKLDLDFEGEIFKMSDLIYNKSDEFPLLLVDLLNVLQGENLEMLKTFFTIMLDSDIERFLAAYIRTKDTNCMIASLRGHRVPEEELLNEFIEREQIIADFLTKEKIDPTVATLARNCQLVVKLQISKLTPLTPVTTTTTTSQEPAPEAAPAPVQVPAPVPAPSVAPAPVDEEPPVPQIIINRVQP